MHDGHLVLVSSLQFPAAAMMSSLCLAAYHFRPATRARSAPGLLGDILRLQNPSRPQIQGRLPALSAHMPDDDLHCCAYGRCLRSQIFRFTVWSGRPPPGAALMNLRYRNERALSAGPKAGHLEPKLADKMEALNSHAGSSGYAAHALHAAPHVIECSILMQHSMGGRSGLEGPGLNQQQKVLYGLGAVFLRYVWARADQAVATQHWGAQPRRSAISHCSL